MPGQPSHRSDVPTAWAVSRRWDDPFSRGAWSLLRVGVSPTTRRQLGRPVNSRVILAGEATHPDQAGMTHGAYEEGQRAAQWAIESGHRRVLVVGAGAAGIGAARLLSSCGIDVTVVEARNRIGGRIHSTIVGGLTAELGANWLQQGERNTLRPIARSLGLRLVDTDFNDPCNVDTNGAAVSTDADSVLAELRCLVDSLGEGVDVSLGELVQQLILDSDAETAASTERVVRSEIALDAGAPLDDLSARYGFEAGVGEGDEWIVGGYRQLLDHLVFGIDLRLSWPVEAVVTTDESVTLSSGGETLVGESAIITVPSAVLQRGDMRFDPPLPATHLDALRSLTVGRVEKVALRYETRWWPSTSSYFRVFGTGTSMSEWLDVTDELGAPMLVGLIVGDLVGQLWDDLDDQGIVFAVSAMLYDSIGRLT